MTRHLARNLYHLMRGAARRTSVERLKRSGHKTVSVLNFRDVQQLIERAIDGTLRRRGLNLDGPGVHDEVRMEFLALMRERDALQDTVDSLLHEREELADNRDHLSEALTQATVELESEQLADPAETEEARDLDELKATVESRLRELLAGHPGADAMLGEQALALVVQAIDEQRQVAMIKAQEAHGSRMGDLNRRIEKLKAKLAETEEMLARARAEGGFEGLAGEPVDPGLKLGDPNYTTKKELLSEIFRLNVELRQMLNTN